MSPIILYSNPFGVIFSFCEKNLRAEFHTMFSITIRRYITMIIMEIDKFDKSDLTPDMLDLHISFAMKWYLMDIEMNNHQKKTRRLVEEIKRFSNKNEA